MAAPSRAGVNTPTLIYLVGFLDLLGVSMIIPLMSRHARDLGATPTVSGMLGSLYGFLQLFSSPMVGQWSDHAGRRRVLLWSLFLSACGYMLLGASTSLTMMFFARIPTGLFKHTQNQLKVTLSEMVPRKDHALTFGRYNAVSTMGFVLGPVIGGHLGDLPMGFNVVATCTAAIFLCNFVLVLYLTPPDVIQGSDSGPVMTGRNQSSQGGYKSGFRLRDFIGSMWALDWPNLWDIFTIRFVMGFAVIVYRSNFSLMLDTKFQASGKIIGYIISYGSIISTMSGFFVGRIAGLYRNDSRLLLHVCFLQFLSICGVTFSPSLLTMILCLTPLSLANAIARVCLTNLTIQRIHGDQTGAVLGLGASTLSVARMISPALAGLAQEFHVSGPGIVGSLSSAVGMVILLLSRGLSEHHKGD